MCTGLVSALLRIPVRRSVAMTGEITLRGRVLPIGGLKEKILAAHRAGITTVIMPKENAKDLRDIPKRVLKALKVALVEHMDEVLRVALVLPNPEEFLKEPSQPVDWRVPIDRRAERDRRDESRIPVASAVPPPSAVESSGGIGEPAAPSDGSTSSVREPAPGERRFPPLPEPSVREE
jgi:ATP-dependent Lon protease